MFTRGGEEGESLTSIKEVKSREVKITLVAFVPARYFPSSRGKSGAGRREGRGGESGEVRGRQDSRLSRQ